MPKSNIARTIFTHKHPDLDACASVWAARTYIRGAERLPIHFVSADWDGRGFGRRPEDLLLDLSAGIKGERDAAGRQHSCFAQLMKRHAPLEEQRALQALVQMVDATDSTGNAYLSIAPELTAEHARQFSSTGLSAVLSALATGPDVDDWWIVTAMSQIFDGMRKRALAQEKKRAMAKDPRIVKRYTASTGDVACLVTGAQGMNSVLFEEGPQIRFVIYTSPNGSEYGVNRNDLATMLDLHNTHVQKVLLKAGEAGKWFVHPNGFLLSWGTHKAPAQVPSRVRAEDLAQAYVDYLESLPKAAQTTSPSHR